MIETTCEILVRRTDGASFRKLSHGAIEKTALMVMCVCLCVCKPVGPDISQFLMGFALVYAVGDGNLITQFDLVRLIITERKSVYRTKLQYSR